MMLSKRLIIKTHQSRIVHKKICQKFHLESTSSHLTSFTTAKTAATSKTTTTTCGINNTNASANSIRAMQTLSSAFDDPSSTKHPLISSSLTTRTTPATTPDTLLHRHNQVRFMGRKDGHSAFYKPRKTPRKQLKKYHRRKRKEHFEKVGKHSKPGSRAVPRREEERIEWQNLVELGAGKISRGMQPESLEYNYGDAIVDDLFGNTAGLTSTPTPKRLNMSRQYEKYYSLVSGLMNDYHKSQEHHQLTIENQKDDDNTDAKNALSTPLPTDKQISLLVRSFQDKQGSKSKTKAIGIAKALQHLIVDIRVPTALFGERTYSSLMYCAATPKEARRIMKMMDENGHPPGPYAYSILVDIHAKKGDFRGADEVLSEMKFAGIEPTLAAYTSLLASCYKAINTPSMPQSIKAEAGTLGWERWKDMRIKGIEADVMAYGAIIRIMAARGLPERAINLIEEMQVMDVQPTTLIFTSSLRAVARSHANALRFQGGFSKKNKRREKLALHHGRMTRKIVSLAEQAQVKQDDGFTSALMICAATAGDAATTKAIYLASEVRKLEDLRIIGGPDHLRRFHEFDDNPKGDDILGLKSGVDHLSLAEGVTDLKEEQNADDSQFNDVNTGLTVNNDENTVQYDETKDVPVPQRKRRPRKDTRVLNALLRANANAMEERGLGDMWEGIENKGFLDENSLRLLNARYKPKYVDKSIPGASDKDSGSDMVWDDDDDAHKIGKRLRRKKFMGLLEDTEDNTIDDLDPALYRLFVEDEDPLFDIDKSHVEDSSEQTFKFDGSKVIEIPIQSSHDQDENKDSHFDMESSESNESNDEAFEFIEGKSQMGFMNSSKNDNDTSAQSHGTGVVMRDEADQSEIDFESLMGDMGDLDMVNMNLDKIPKDILSELSNDHEIFETSDLPPDVEEEQKLNSNLIPVSPEKNLSLEELVEEEKDELDLILYGMPETRIEKVRDEFKSTLGDPSMLSLVPLLRENMPENIDLAWLREKNLQDAEVVIDKAKEDKVVDIHLLDSMLQVLAKSENLDDALAFYDEQYSLHKLSHTPKSNRNVLQMLVKANRITQALDFKDKIETAGKKLDLLSYGSLIEYFGNKGQIGSAIAMLKECKNIHGSPPGEKSLKHLRINCRKAGVEKSFHLEGLIGKDPIEWVKEGENERKREYSKRGRRQILLAKNRLLNI